MPNEDRPVDLDSIDEADLGGSLLPAEPTVAEIRDATPEPKGRRGRQVSSASDIPGDSQQARMAADVEIARGAAKDRILRRRTDSVNLGEAYQTFLSNDIGGYFIVERTGPRSLPEEERGIMQERVTVNELASSTIEELCSRKFGGGEYRVQARTSDHGFADVPEHFFKVGGEINPVSDTGRRWIEAKNRRDEPARAQPLGGDSGIAAILQSMQSQNQMMMQGFQEIARALTAKPDPEAEARRWQQKQEAERQNREWEARLRREQQEHDERVERLRVEAEEAKERRIREAEERRAEREAKAAAEAAERDRRNKLDELERQAHLETLRAQAKAERQRTQYQYRATMAQMEHQTTGGLGKKMHETIIGRMAEVFGDAKIAQMKKAMGVEDEDDSSFMDVVKDGLKDALQQKGPELFDALAKKLMQPTPGVPVNPADALLAEAALRVRQENAQAAPVPASIPMEPAPQALPAPAAPQAAAEAPAAPAEDDVLARLDGIARGSATVAVQAFSRSLALAIRQQPEADAAWDIVFIADAGDLYQAYGRMPVQAREAFKASPTDGFVKLVAQVSPEDAKMLEACMASSPAASQWVKDLEALAPWHDEDDEDVDE